MILINLLPHREAKRKRRQQVFLVGLALAAATGLVAGGLWYGVVQQLISGQQGRNEFLIKENAKLELEIKDVASLKADIESLRARQRAVENLQNDRNMPVHLLNELVRHTPEGVYLNSIKQDGDNVTVLGVAQTNERVSELLRNLSNSEGWIERPDLVEIKAVTQQAANKSTKHLFDFSMRMHIKRPKDPNAPEAASGVPAGKKKD